MRAISPKGSDIKGTLEKLYGCASVANDMTRDADGKLVWDHDGNCTEVYWDDSESYRRDGELIFLCESGDEWKETEIILLGPGDAIFCVLNVYNGKRFNNPSLETPAVYRLTETKDECIAGFPPNFLKYDEAKEMCDRLQAEYDASRTTHVSG